ncbi:MAG: adenylate cyclase [Mariniblastus sp.]|jgi:adenylate cyclase
MFELIAQGTHVDSRWRRQILEPIVEIGRTTQSFRVPWDSQISRRHVKLLAGKRSIKVEKLADASNPVFFNGCEETSFEVKPGQHFVIGKTTFTLTTDRAFVTQEVPSPISQKTFSPEFLRQMPYRDADRRIEVLNRIPEAIASSVNTRDLLIQFVNTLMAGINAATTIGIVQLNSKKHHVADSSKQVNAIEVIQWDRRGLDRGDFQPSESLIRQAIKTEETILHIWSQQKRIEAEYTFDYENDWAFVSPMSSDASPGWGIYVAGTNRGSGSTGDTVAGEDLQGDVKFCELVGSTLKNILKVKQLERQQSSLRSFFSPVVIEAFVGRDPDEVLKPRKCEMSVLFCDLRGFSKASEAMADNLLELLERVSESLGVMTRKILKHGGVIGDFHGDSAMGFWGWPLESEHEGQNAANAIKAALEIQQAVDADQLQNQDSNRFQIGLGIASGEAVAGKIGTQDQVKVTAFGPVVNLASRLEGMTKKLASRILVDGETVRRMELGDSGDVKASPRSLGRFQPFGLESSIEVFQILPVGAIPKSELKLFAYALEQFQSGDWKMAHKTLASMPESDTARLYFDAFMATHGNVCPEDWDGVIRMQAK